MFNEKILKLTPYVVSDRFTIEDPHEWLFLDWNETNYALAQEIQDRMLIAIKNGAGVRYADGDDRILNSAIAEFTNVSKDNIFTVINIKNGFNISIGCNLKKYKSIQRLAPFTSTPIIGTSARKTNERINKGTIILFNNEISIAEIKIMINKAKIVKLKCFEKKK